MKSNNPIKFDEKLAIYTVSALLVIVLIYLASTSLKVA
ncbi:Uncharacterised protein [Candidatus Burarchaeum australiense]|nr:Uncharacterised protein [Candidatus Burarchaeum australiense]